LSDFCRGFLFLSRQQCLSFCSLGSKHSWPSLNQNWMALNVHR
jgi:hypothetical protein